MPCIQTMATGTITPQQEETLKIRFGQAIALLPGKSENYLMVTFTDHCRIWFQGNQDGDAAFVEVKIFGGAGRTAYDKLTAELTRILQEVLGLRADRIYIKYEEVNTWGWNGSNF